MWDVLAELLLDPSGIIDEVRDRRRERRARQRAQALGISCALRIVDGTHPGLRRRWTRGAARVPPGALVFEPDSRWRSRVTIPVRSATLQPPEHVPGRRLRARGARPRRIVLETARSTLEWQVPEEQVHRAMGLMPARGRLRSEAWRTGGSTTSSSAPGERG